MRQETNKEIDLLLRRLSRRDGEAVRDAETQIDESHLDADELSSYAQNVAPPKARASPVANDWAAILSGDIGWLGCSPTGSLLVLIGAEFVPLLEQWLCR